MPTRQPNHPAQPALRIFAANERLNQLLIEHLDPAVWTAKPPGNVRTIAAIFTHMHNVRTKWIRLTAPHLKVPAQLNRAHCTPQQARKALAGSAARCEEMLADVDAGRIKGKRISNSCATAGPNPGPQAPSYLPGCSATCSRTKPITAARSRCSPTSLATLCRKPSHRICGTGKSSGSSAGHHSDN